MSSCLDALNQYAELLNTYPQSSDNGNESMPQPLFFELANCTGAAWPNLNGTQNTYSFAGGSVSNTFPGSVIGSLYIPSYWQVNINGTNYPEKPSNYPLLISNLLDFNGTTTASTFDVTVPINFNVNEWRLQMCMNQINAVVGSIHLSSWQQGSSECDSYMDTYCQPYNQGCGSNGYEPDPITGPAIPCTCKIEQNCLQTTLCKTGDANCSSDAVFASNFPVTCLGKYCTTQGYRWSYMANQNCTITKCEQIISLVGQNIVAKGGSDLWCGNKTIPVSPTPTPSVPNNGVTGIHLPTYVWILIAAGIFLIAIVVPLAVIIYRRNKVEQKMKNVADANV